ncbi:PLDc N-terminal domain-containing protein [Terrabacter sp. NPDC080008]|uniref:PLDc N-terminal domain-containing protein n=1 Tax=Terrabacter sp. NPDC080008 TaxID=3155176 RepID=UPI00344CA9B5
MRTPPTSMLVTIGVFLAFWAYCLYDFARTDERDMRGFTRPVWLVVLVFGSVAGGLLWLLAGRPQHSTRR